MTTDLLTVCLVPRALIERAGSETDRKHREQVRSAFKVFKWYGSIVNIQPCVFNVAVDVFELVDMLAVHPSSEAYDLFADSYLLEEQNGHNHRVTGDIWCVAGSVAEILSTVFDQKS